MIKHSNLHIASDILRIVLISAMVLFSLMPLCASAEELPENPEPTADATYSESDELQESDTEDSVNESSSASEEVDIDDLPLSAETDGEATTPSTGGVGPEEENGDVPTAQVLQSDAVDSIAEDAVDLNAAWSDQNGGLASNYTITTGGVYRLTADLTVTAVLLINASGEDVTICFDGHTLTCNETNMGYAIRVSSAASVTLDGASEEDSCLTYVGGNLNYIIYSGASEFKMNDMTLFGTSDEDHLNVSSMASYGVYLNSGSLEMDDCSVTVDLSNQMKSSLTTNSNTLKGSPAGIYLTNSVTGANLNDCTVRVLNNPNAARASTSESTLGYAYGLQSLAKADVTVSGGSYSVRSLLGEVSCIAARSLCLRSGANQEPVILNPDGGVASIGVQATSSSQQITLDSGMDLTYGGETTPQLSAALYATSVDRFIFGEGFACQRAAVWVATTTDNVNEDGFVIGTFVEGVSAAAQGSIAAMLLNGKGADSSCDITVEDGRLIFSLNAERAPVQVVDTYGAVSPYSSVAEAIAGVNDGGTVQLLADAGGVAFNKSAGTGTSYSLDLNGYSISSLTCSTSATLTVTSSSASSTSTICGPNSREETQVVSLSGSGSYFFKGIVVRCVSTNAATAIEMSSSCSLSLENVDVDACAMKGPVRGIYATGAVEFSVVGGRISVATEGATSAAYGIVSTNSKSDVDLFDCPITVSAVGGDAGGVDAAGTLTVSGSNASNESITVDTRKPVSHAWGIRMKSSSTATSVCNLRSCQIMVSGGGDVGSGSYWCLMAGEDVNDSPVQWTFTEGQVLLSSCNNTAVGVNSLPIQIASGVDFGTSPVTLACTDLEERQAIRALNGEDISGYTNFFIAAHGARYEDWNLTPTQDGSALVWTSESSVVNIDSGKGYQTLGDAFADCADGAHLCLISDRTASSAIVLDMRERKISIDLLGHTLTLVPAGLASAGNSGDGGGLVVNGPGDLELTDSVGNGSLDILVGTAGETSSSVATPYQGIVINEGAAFSLCSVDVQINYTGSANAAVEADMRGIAVNDGSLVVSTDACLNVSGYNGADPSGYGATEVAAIYVAKNASSVDIDGSAQVNADNSSLPVEHGTPVYPETHGTSNIALQAVNLKQLYLIPGDGLYERAQERFRETAKLDATVDSTGYKYGTEIYYSGQMLLEDGTYLWAYSDPIDASEMGNLDKIEASLFFIQSNYEEVPEATGVSSADDFMGTTNIRGTVSAVCAQGNARGVYALAGTWVLNDAKISAIGGSSKHNVRGEVADLRNFIDFPTPQPNMIFYPEAGQARIVRELSSVAYAIDAETAANVVLYGATFLCSDGAESCDIHLDSFTISETYVPQEPPATVGNAAAANEEGEPFAGITFEGEIDSGLLAGFVDAYGDLVPVVQGDGLVWQEEGTAYFYVQGKLLTKKNGLEVGQAVELPGENETRRLGAFSYHYEFIGWSSDPGATTIDESAGDIPAGTSSFIYEQPVTYHAIYAQIPDDINVTFTNIRDVAGNVMNDVVYDVPYRSDLSACGVVVPSSEDYIVNDIDFRFVGWMPDTSNTWSSDYVVACTMDALVEGVTTGSVTFTASYVPVASDESLVSFWVDDNLTAYAEKIGTSPSYAEAIAPSGDKVPAKINALSNYTYSFRGWAVGRSDITEWQEGDDTLTGTLPVCTGDDVTYTARFAVLANKQTITFYYWRSGSSAPTYSSTSLSVALDSDVSVISQTLVKIGDVITVGTLNYTFLGWSSRPSDLLPLYGEDLPPATDSATYYGIYESEERGIDVTFMVEDQVYAYAGGLDSSMTIDAAFQETGLPEPVSSSGWEFEGWALTPYSLSAERGSLITLSEACEKAGLSSDSLTLYALFSAPYQPYVYFYTGAGGTLLTYAEVEQGQTISELGIEPDPPVKAGCYFAGWQTSEGELYDLTTPVYDDVFLYARFLEIGTDTTSLKSADIDVGNCYIARGGMEDAEDVTFRLGQAENVDTTLSKRLASDAYAVTDSYTIQLGYLLAEQSYAVSNGFGSVKLTLPVSSSKQVKVYWLRTDGSVGVSSTKEVSAGTVSVTLADYGVVSSKANLVVAHASKATSKASKKKSSTGVRTTASKSSKAPSLTKTGKGAPLKASDLSDPLAAATNASNAKTKSSALKKQDVSEASSDISSGDGTSSSQNSEPMASEEDAGVSANTVLFYVICGLLLLALIAFIWWLIRRYRRRSSPDDSDEPPTPTPDGIRF